MFKVNSLLAQFIYNKHQIIIQNLRILPKYEEKPCLLLETLNLK